MELFHKIIIIVAVVLFGISLTWFGVQIHSSKSTSSSVYPPTFATLPDYWEIHADTKLPVVPMVRNKPSITLLTDVEYDTNMDTARKIIYYRTNPGFTPGYNPTNNTVNFADPSWASYVTGVANRTADCIYQEWANRVGVTWDGITNYNQC